MGDLLHLHKKDLNCIMLSPLFLKKGLYLTSFEKILNMYYLEEKARVMVA